jgi:integrase
MLGFISCTNGAMMVRHTLYSLRHVYASVKIKLGTNPKRLQALMGHASIQLTMDTYGHLWKDEEADRKEAMELDKHFAGLMDRASI